MLISNYKRVENAQNAPSPKCYYCKRRSRLKPFAGYYLCIWCSAMHKVMSSAILSKPVLKTGQYHF